MPVMHPLPLDIMGEVDVSTGEVVVPAGGGGFTYTHGALNLYEYSVDCSP